MLAWVDGSDLSGLGTKAKTYFGNIMVPECMIFSVSGNLNNLIVLIMVLPGFPNLQK